MANKITYDSLGGKEVERLKAEFEALKIAYKLLNDEIAKGKTAIQENVNVSKTANTNTTQGQQAVEQAYKNTKTTVYGLTEAQKELNKVELQLKEAQTQHAVEVAKLNIQLQEQRKANKEAAKEESGLIGAYAKKARTLNELRNRYKDLIAEGKGLEKGTIELGKRVSKLDDELKGIDAQAGQFQRNVGNYEKGFISFGNAIKGALGFIGITAGFDLLKTGLKDLVASTQLTSDAWEEFTTGASFAYDKFLKTVVSGDWSNFFYNISRAYTEGKEFAKMIDELTEKGYALSISQATTNLEVAKLERTLKNTNLSAKERAEAGKKILDLENAQLEKNLKLKKDTYEAQALQLKALGKLEKQEFIDFIKRYDEDEALRKRAIRLMELEKATFDKSNLGAGGQGVNAMTSEILAKRSKEATDRLNEYKTALGGTLETTQKYGETLTKYNLTNDAQAKPVIDAYIDLINTEEQFYTGTRKNFLAYENALADINKEEADKLKNELTAYEKLKKEISELNKQLETEVTLKSENAKITATTISEKTKLLEKIDREILWLKNTNKELNLQINLTNELKQNYDNLGTSMSSSADAMEEIDKALLNFDENNKTDKQKQIEAITKKYDELIKKAQQNMLDEEIINKLRNNKQQELLKINAKQTAENIQKVVYIGQAIYEEAHQKEMSRIDKEIEAHQRKYDRITALAELTSQTAQQNSAFEERQAALLELKKEKRARRAKFIEAGAAIIKDFSARLETEKPAKAAASTLTDTSIIIKAISLLMSAKDGAIDTGNGGNLDKDKGFLAVLHPHETVIPEAPATEIRKHLGHNFAFDEVATAVKEKKQRDMQQIELQRYHSNDAVINKLDQLQNAIENKPAYMGRDFDATHRAIVETIESKYKIEKNYIKLRN